jgi:hypothetical protein
MRVACMRPRRQRVPRWPKIAIQARGRAGHLHQRGARAVHELLVELATICGLGVLDQLEAHRHIDPRVPVATDFRRRPYARS